MMSGLLTMARSGSLDADLLSSPQFYGTDYTKPLLFIADGTFMANQADAEHLSGDQWGMMNETGNYPGQAWLWLYTMWYQIPPFTTSGNADALVWAHHDAAHLGAVARAIHPRAALHPPGGPRLPPHLARPLPPPGRGDRDPRPRPAVTLTRCARVVQRGGRRWMPQEAATATPGAGWTMAPMAVTQLP